MNTSSRSPSLQAYNLLVFRTAVHPEFFEILERKRIAHGDYDFEAWVMPGGHAVRFEHSGLCVTELVTERADVPERGLVTTLPCAGEKDHEAEIADRITYIVSIQTETLTDHLYLDTHTEMLEHARINESMIVEWGGEVGQPNLSLLDVQRYSEEVQIQSYHLRNDCGLVLRTQSIFQIKPID